MSLSPWSPDSILLIYVWGCVALAVVMLSVRDMTR